MKNWYKISQQIPSLEFSTHTGTNRRIVKTVGNVYPIYQKLKAMGFTWYGQGKFWWAYSERLTPEKIAALKNLGLNTAPVETAAPAAIPSPEGQVPPVQPEAIQPQAIPEQAPISVRTNKDRVEKFDRGNFPTNPDIYSTDIPVNVNGQDLVLHIKVGRTTREQYSGPATIPYYTYEITVNGEYVRGYKVEAPGRWGKSGANYNEDQVVDEFIKKIPTNLEKKEGSKLYNAILYYLEKQKHNPEYAQLRKDMEDYTKSKNLSHLIPDRKIEITDPRYKGIYDIKVDVSASSIHLETKVNHPLAPRAATLDYIGVPPVEIHTIEDLNKFIDDEINKNKIEIEQKYIKYLQSFAFSEEEQKATSEQMKVIASYVINNVQDIEIFKNELMKRGYVRPRKSRGQSGAGMVPSGYFQLIIDDKKIREDTFKRGSHANSPDYFYTALAYYIMRIKHHNIGFMPILLVDAMRDVADNAKRYGHDINIAQVEEYMESIARKIYTDVTGRRYSSWQDNWANFYSGGFGGSGAREVGEASPTVTINDFASFAEKLGFDKNLATSSPKSVYRQIALKYHPDSFKGTEEEKEKAANIFMEATELYDELPENVKTASNWYWKLK